MVLQMLSLMDTLSRYLLSCIGVRSVIVSSGYAQRDILSASRHRLRRSDRASPANQQPIDGYPALAAVASVIGSDLKVSLPVLIIFCNWVKFR
jgi:hypothetical protein